MTIPILNRLESERATWLLSVSLLTQIHQFQPCLYICSNQTKHSLHGYNIQVVTPNVKTITELDMVNDNKLK